MKERKGVKWWEEKVGRGRKKKKKSRRTFQLECRRQEVGYPVDMHKQETNRQAARRAHGSRR